jgi:hypothetical protein
VIVDKWRRANGGLGCARPVDNFQFHNGNPVAPNNFMSLSGHAHEVQRNCRSAIRDFDPPASAQIRGKF